MNQELTDKEYAKQCYEDICDIVILHSLDFNDLLKLDGPLFPINFEVWNETQRVASVIEYKSYRNTMDNNLAEEIGKYLRSLLTIPSEKWIYEEFKNNPFWKQSRKTARMFKDKLGIGNRDYWD